MVNKLENILQGGTQLIDAALKQREQRRAEARGMILRLIHGESPPQGFDLIATMATADISEALLREMADAVATVRKIEGETPSLDDAILESQGCALAALAHEIATEQLVKELRVERAVEGLAKERAGLNAIAAYDRACRAHDQAHAIRSRYPDLFAIEKIAN